MSIKFKSEKSVLLSLIQPAMYATSNKSSLPALKGLLFSLEGNVLSIYGYDLEKGIKTSQTVFGKENGSVVVNADKVSGIIKNLPECDITFDCDGKNVVTITGADSIFVIHGIEASAFPALPELHGENTIKIKAETLIDVITSTSHAVATTDSRPVYMGELFKVENGNLTVVSADYCRMAVRQIEGCVKSEKDVYSFVVPGKSLNDLVRLMPNDDTEVGIEFTRKYVIFRCEDFVMFSRLLEGEFIDYTSVIPNPGKTFVRVNRQALIESVERASLLVDEKTRSPLRFVFSNNNLKIHCLTDLGKVDETVKIQLTGDDLEIGFNNRYVLDALRACRDEEIKLTLFSPLMSMIITPAEQKDGNSYLYLVLPLRLRN